MSELERYAIGQAPKTRKTNPNGKSREERAQARALKKEKQAQGLDANQPFALPEGQAEQMHQRQQENFKMMQDAGVLGGIKRDTGSNLDYLRPRSEQAEINQGAQAAGRQKQQDTFARGRAAVAEGKQAQYMRNSENAENVAMRGRFTEDGVTNFFNDRQGAAADVAQGGRPQSDMRTMVLPDGSIGMGSNAAQPKLPQDHYTTMLPTGSGLPMAQAEAFSTGTQGKGIYEMNPAARGNASAQQMDAADARNFSTQQGIRDQMGSFSFDGNAEVPYAPVPSGAAPMGVPAASPEQAQVQAAPSPALVKDPRLPELPGTAADPTDGIRQMMQNGEDPTATIDQMLDMGMITPDQAYEYENAWLAKAGLSDAAPEVAVPEPVLEQSTAEDAALRERAQAIIDERGYPVVTGLGPMAGAVKNDFAALLQDQIMPIFTGPQASTGERSREAQASYEQTALEQEMEILRRQGKQPPVQSPTEPNNMAQVTPQPSSVPGTGPGIPENPPEKVPVPGTEGTTFEGTLEQLPAQVQSGEMTLGMIDRLLQTGTISAAQADVLEALALQLTQQ